MTTKVSAMTNENVSNCESCRIDPWKILSLSLFLFSEADQPRRLNFFYNNTRRRSFLILLVVSDVPLPPPLLFHPRVYAGLRGKCISRPRRRQRLLSQTCVKLAAAAKKSKERENINGGVRNATQWGSNSGHAQGVGYLVTL